MIRVLIVAPYAALRAGLHALLADAADDLQILDEVGAVGEWERLLPEENEATPPVVLLDTGGAENGGELARVLALPGGGAPGGLVVLGEGAARDLLLLARAAPSGWAYLSRDTDGIEIAGAIRAAAAGLAALDRRLVSRLATAPTPEAALSGEALTAREGEVLQLMAQGLPNKIIATRLGISLHTVKFHVASILAKLGATSRTEAVTLGVRRGYVLL